jgi:hypothetical protein
MAKKADRPKEKNPAAVALAKRRAESLTPKRRKEIAKVASQTRWKKEAE